MLAKPHPVEQIVKKLNPDVGEGVKEGLLELKVALREGDKKDEAIKVFLKCRGLEKICGMVASKAQRDPTAVLIVACDILEALPQEKIDPHTILKVVDRALSGGISDAAYPHVSYFLAHALFARPNPSAFVASFDNSALHKILKAVTRILQLISDSRRDASLIEARAAYIRKSCLQALITLREHPNCASILRGLDTSEAIGSTLLDSTPGKEEIFSAAKLLVDVFDKRTAEFFAKHNIVSTLVKMLRGERTALDDQNTSSASIASLFNEASDHPGYFMDDVPVNAGGFVQCQLWSLRLILKFLEVNGDIEQASLISLSDFIMSCMTEHESLPSTSMLMSRHSLMMSSFIPRNLATCDTSALLNTEITQLLRALFSDRQRMLKILHLKFLPPGNGIEMLKPLLLSNDPKIQAFGCKKLREVTHLRFDCASCGKRITDTRRYYSSSTQSVCLSCPVNDVYMHENADFRWQAMVRLLKPSADLLNRLVYHQNMFGPYQDVMAKDLLATFATVAESGCFHQEMVKEKVLTIALETILQCNEKTVGTEPVQHSLAIASHLSKTGHHQQVSGLAHRISSLMNVFGDEGTSTAIEILTNCFEVCTPTEVSEALIAIVPKAYPTNEDDEKMYRAVASCIKQGVTLLSDAATAPQLKSVVENGLTAALLHVLKACTKFETKAACLASCATILPLEKNSRYLNSPSLLQQIAQVFQDDQATARTVTEPGARVVKYLIACEKPPLPEPQWSWEAPPVAPDTPAGVSPLSGYNSKRGSIKGSTFSSSAEITITPPATESAFNPSVVLTPRLQTSQPTWASDSAIEGVFQRASGPSCSIKPSLLEKASVLLSDEGFQMLWLFSGGSSAVRQDTIDVMTGITPAIVAMVGKGDSGAKGKIPYIMAVLSELSKDPAYGHGVARLWAVMAADPKLKCYFTMHGLASVIDCAASTHRESQLYAIIALRSLIQGDGPLTLREQSVKVQCQFGNSVRELEIPASELRLSKVKNVIRSLYPGTTLADRGVGKIKMGRKELRSDKDLELLSASGLITVEPELATTPRTQKKAKKKRRWRLGDEIGKGGFGTVFTVVDENSAEQYAAKRFRLQQDDPDRQKTQESFVNEMSLLSHLEHENIVKYIDAFTDKGTGYLVMERMSYSVLDFRARFGIPENLARQFVTHALKGLRYLHQKNVMHLDLKAANLLLTQNGIVKVADFGCGVRFQVDGGNGRPGTLPFMAPEVITERRFSTASDVWSLGCTLIEMMYGLVWCPKEVTEQIVFVALVKERFERGETPLAYLDPVKHKVSPGCLAFLQRCMQIKPQDRPTADDLLHDPWINQPDMAETLNMSCENINQHIANQTHHLLKLELMNESVADGLGKSKAGLGETMIMTAPPSMNQTLIMSAPPSMGMDQTMIMSAPPSMAMDQTMVMTAPPSRAMNETLVMTAPPTEAGALLTEPDAASVKKNLSKLTSETFHTAIPDGLQLDGLAHEDDETTPPATSKILGESDASIQGLGGTRPQRAQMLAQHQQQQQQQLPQQQPQLRTVRSSSSSSSLPSFAPASHAASATNFNTANSAFSSNPASGKKSPASTSPRQAQQPRSLTAEPKAEKGLYTSFDSLGAASKATEATEAHGAPPISFRAKALQNMQKERELMAAKDKDKEKERSVPGSVTSGSSRDLKKRNSKGGGGGTGSTGDLFQPPAKDRAPRDKRRPVAELSGEGGSSARLSSAEMLLEKERKRLFRKDTRKLRVVSTSPLASDGPNSPGYSYIPRDTAALDGFVERTQPPTITGGRRQTHSFNRVATLPPPSDPAPFKDRPVPASDQSTPDGSLPPTPEPKLRRPKRKNSAPALYRDVAAAAANGNGNGHSRGYSSPKRAPVRGRAGPPEKEAEQAKEPAKEQVKEPGPKRNNSQPARACNGANGKAQPATARPSTARRNDSLRKSPRRSSPQAVIVTRRRRKNDMPESPFGDSINSWNSSR
ncbi:Mitogen-activated protein kinase kinase kinase 2 [Diplonema papillatum]|nr:Mitogen-activated protein kinase kinase kinase 2 [Diplonema papillatum]